MLTMRSKELRGDISKYKIHNLLLFLFNFKFLLCDDIFVAGGWKTRIPLSFTLTFTMCITFTFTFCRGKEDKDNVVLYFDSWPREELCIALPLKQDTIINEVKPAVVSLYDYYNTDDKASVLYSLK